MNRGQFFEKFVWGLKDLREAAELNESYLGKMTEAVQEDIRAKVKTGWTKIGLELAGIALVIGGTFSVEYFQEKEYSEERGEDIEMGKILQRRLLSLLINNDYLQKSKATFKIRTYIDDKGNKITYKEDMLAEKKEDITSTIMIVGKFKETEGFLTTPDGKEAPFHIDTSKMLIQIRKDNIPLWSFEVHGSLAISQKFLASQDANQILIEVPVTMIIDGKSVTASVPLFLGYEHIATIQISTQKP